MSRIFAIIFFAGTLIRVSAAAGCRSLITTKGSMDVWDPKVLRCAAGGHFHLPIFYSLPWESISKHFEKNTRIFMADSNVQSKSKFLKGVLHCNLFLVRLSRAWFSKKVKLNEIC